MLPQKVHDRQKAALIEATVKAVVSDGVENLTTKSIDEISGVKEVYIYRYFDNKEDLIAKTFTVADEALLKTISDSFSVISYKSIDFQMRCRLLFKSCWDYILAHPDWLIFYVRYYYSQSFQKYSYDAHIKRYEIFLEKMRPICHPDADVKTVLHHILDTLLGQARKQIMHPENLLQVTDDTFWLLFSVIKGGQQI